MTNTEFRNALKALDLKQTDIAAFFGRDVTTVNRWAVGTRPVPRYVEIYLLGQHAVEIQK